MKSGKSRLWDILQLAWTQKNVKVTKQKTKIGDYSTLKETDIIQPNTIHDPWLDLEYKTKHKHTESLAIKDICGKLKKFIR